ncbi:MAG: hypothetical protein HWN66_20555 [Candidatus Helarchaeota archaeon]|nr:hypothetical protein [Candidatus Helarchaeota archaeon]
MGIDDTTAAFFIFSSIVVALFIVIYRKVYKQIEIPKGHKIIYAISCPFLMILEGIAIFGFDFLMNWEEVSLFNIIWIPFFLMMLEDLNIQTWISGIILAIISIVLIFLSLFCFVSISTGLIYFISLWKWPEWPPLSIFIICVIVVVPLLTFGGRMFGKYEKQAFEGKITTGERLILHFLGLSLGSILMGMGLTPLITKISGWMGGDHWMPFHVAVPSFIIGLILVVYCFFVVLKEIFKRRQLKYDF